MAAGLKLGAAGYIYVMYIEGPLWTLAVALNITHSADVLLGVWQLVL